MMNLLPRLRFKTPLCANLKPMVPGSRLGRYTLVYPLGGGVSGEVWQARSDSGQCVACKVVTNATTRELERLAASSVQSIRHPNLTKVHTVHGIDAAGRVARTPEQEVALLVTMELGQVDLQTWLADQHEQVPMNEIIDLLDGVARALDYLNHERGMVHGDVKPANLIRQGNSVQLTDFGCLTMVGESMQWKGSPAYKSLNHAVADTDVFSLAVTVAELAQNRLPYPPAALQRSQLDELAELQHQQALDFSDLPPAIQQVLRRATHPQPEQRYRTCAALLAALRSALVPRSSQHTSVSRSLLRLGRFAYAEQAYGEALTYFIRAAEEGCALGAENAGKMYALGLGADRDHERATHFVGLAAQRSRGQVAFELAEHFDRRGSKSLARFWYRVFVSLQRPGRAPEICAPSPERTPERTPPSRETTSAANADTQVADSRRRHASRTHRPTSRWAPALN